MKLKPQTAFLVALLVFIIGITITTAMGMFTTKTAKVPAKLDSEGYADSYDPADIRGSYTFSEISELYGVPLKDLSAAFELGEDAGTVKVSELKERFTTSGEAIETSSVRLFVAYFKNLPYEVTEEVFLPKPAADILLTLGNLSPDQVQYLQTHTVMD